MRLLVNRLPNNCVWPCEVLAIDRTEQWRQAATSTAPDPVAALERSLSGWLGSGLFRNPPTSWHPFERFATHMHEVDLQPHTHATYAQKKCMQLSLKMLWPFRYADTARGRIQPRISERHCHPPSCHCRDDGQTDRGLRSATTVDSNYLKLAWPISGNSRPIGSSKQNRCSGKLDVNNPANEVHPNSHHKHRGPRLGATEDGSSDNVPDSTWHRSKGVAEAQ